MSDESGQVPNESTVVARRAGIVGSFTLMSRVLGAVRDMTITHVFGAGVAYDAFSIALTIPSFLRRLVAEGSLVIAFVPLLAEAKREGGLAAMRSFTRSVLGALIPLLVVLSVFGIVFPEPLVTMFAPGFDPERAQVATSLTRIMMPYIFFISLVAVAGGVLNIEGVFAPTAAAPMLLNVAIISAALFFTDSFASPVEALGWGVFAGGVLQLLLQLPALKKRGLLVLPSFEFRHPRLATLGRRMLPAVFGVAVYQINIMVIRQIGSYLPTGQLSCYNVATRLQEFALGVFAVSVSVAALPTLAEHAAKENWLELRRSFRRALRVTNFVTVPATFGLLAVSAPIVGVLFRHGAFTPDAAAQTSELVMILALALVPIGAVRITVPAFYSFGDTKTPVIAASVSLVTTFVLGHMLRDWLEIQGLVIATSVAALLQMLVLWLLFRRALARRASESLGPTDDTPVFGHATLCTLAILPGAALAWWLSAQHDWNSGRNLRDALLLFPMIVGVGLSYGLFAKLLRIPEVDLILGAVLRRLKRR